MKQFGSYYTSPYKVSEEIRSEVQGFRTTCDAYTVITPNEHEVRLLAHKWGKYSSFAQKAGQKVKPYRNNQYHGFQVGSARYAVWQGRIDSLLGITGDLADATIEEMLGFELRATRVDIACTFDFASPYPDYALQMYQARKLQGNKGKSPETEWKMIASKTGDTLYIGKRGTGKYVRIYDKSFEYTGVNEPGYIWRFEIEYGTGYADTLWQQLRTEIENGRSIQDYMTKRIWGDCYQKGVSLPVRVEALDSSELKKNHTPTDKDRYLSWMSKTVRPVVQWMSAMGYGEEVADALGLQQNFLDIVGEDGLVQAVISLSGPEGRTTV